MLVRKYLDEVRIEAGEALARALGSPQPSRCGAPGAKSQRLPRRATKDVVEVAERLQKVVDSNPGESMQEFAVKLDTTVRELRRPMITLKALGRVKSVGEKSRTRYFPAVSKGSVSVQTPNM